MRTTLTGIAFLIFTSTTVHAQPEDGLGKSLYDLQCIQCHRESLHKRPKPAATNFKEVEEWVARWARHVGAQWKKEDLDAVTQYLNERYYSYPKP